MLGVIVRMIMPAKSQSNWDHKLYPREFHDSASQPHAAKHSACRTTEMESHYYQWQG